MSTQKHALIAALAAALLLPTSFLHGQEAAPSRILKTGSSFGALKVMGNDVYFTDFREDEILGNRSNDLYRSDGTPVGTVNLSNLCSGPVCGPDGIHGIWGSTLYWRVLNSTSQSSQLWAVKPGSTPKFLLAFEPYTPGAVGFRELSPGLVAFQASLFHQGRAQVYTTDGTPAGTVRRDDGTDSTMASLTSRVFVLQGSYLYPNYAGLLAEAPPNPAGPAPYLAPLFSPAPLTTFGDYLLYISQIPTYGGSHLYSKTRHELDGEVLATTGPFTGIFEELPRFGSHLLIQNGNRVLATNGRRNGTFELPRLVATAWPAEYARLGQRIAFVNDLGWLAFSDFTAKGTYALLSPEQGPFSEVTPVGDHLFFRQGTPGQLGVTDGTVAGTRLIELEEGSQPTRFVSIGDRRVVFAATTAAHGEEPWISDGTPEGTYRLDDAVPGPTSSNPRSFAEVGNRLFFVVDKIGGGQEVRVLDLPSARPACPAGRLCLQGGRFEVKVRAITSGQEFLGKRAFGTSESGIFTFFSPNNWEFLVKVLDACAINDRFWVYASAATDVAYELEVKDRASGEIKTYTHAGGAEARPILDGQAFAGCGLEAPPATYSLPEKLQEDARRCPNDFTELCLSDRFRVKAEWQTATGTGKALPVATGSADSGLFTFFSPSNWELMVKVLDGCSINNRHWVFAAGTTDVAWTLTVKDLQTGETKVYTNDLGNPSRTITDSDALGGCP